MSFMCRIKVSTNCIIKHTATSDVHTTFELRSAWFPAVYSIAIGQ